MPFPKPNLFEQYGSVKLFRQALKMGSDDEVAFRATLIDAFVDTANASAYSSGTVGTSGATYNIVDFVSGDPFDVKEILVLNDDSSADLHINPNGTASASTYKVMPNEILKLTMSHVDGDPITSIGLYGTVSAPPVPYRIFVFGLVPQT